MLGLPVSTEMNKMLPKKAIYAKFQLNTAEKEKIDRDISRIHIVNEVNASKVNLEEGKEVKSFYVMNVSLKHKEYDNKSIITLSKLIPQKMIMVLQHDSKARLAVYHTKLMQTEWVDLADMSIRLNGLNMDSVWEDIITQIGGITVEQGRSLDEQIVSDEKRMKLEKEIAKLEKLARTEKQPKKKFELVQRIKNYKEKMENGYE